MEPVSHAIKLLDQRDPPVAAMIHRLLQRSYRAEADLLGLDDFPPLRRSLVQVRQATTEFRGCCTGSVLSAAVELEVSVSHLDICSLVVDPAHFRRGFARLLLRHVLNRPDTATVVVETAAANHPALALYQGHGFTPCRYWTTADGIAKVALNIEITQRNEPQPE